MKDKKQKEGVVPLKTFPQYTCVALRHKPIADQILAWCMLKTDEGRLVFPNINPDDVLYIVNDGLLYREDANRLYIGCGRDPRFDPETHTKDTWNSSSVMMDRVLGLSRKYPLWQKVIEEVRSDFRGRFLKSGEIALMARSLYDSHGGNDDQNKRVISWVEKAYFTEVEYGDLRNVEPLEKHDIVRLLQKHNSPDLAWFQAIIRESQLHHDQKSSEAKNLFSKSVPYEFKHSQYGKLSVRIFDTDNEKIASLCWKEKKVPCDFLVVKKSNGQIAIQTRASRNFDMTDVWKRLVECEPGNRGSSIWALFQGPNMVLNGSRSNPDVPASNLTLEEIVQIIEEVLTQKKLFERLLPTNGDVLENVFGRL
jgi:hypothetical protein